VRYFVRGKAAFDGLGRVLTVAELTVKLAILGVFELRDSAGRVMDLPGQKDRALLAYLASPPGVSRAREALASLFWGDHGGVQARDNLKHALSRLRQSLGQAGSTSIIADRQTVRLEGGAVEVDGASFEQLLRIGTTQSLAEAVALYRGELLEGINVRSALFEEWLLSERRRLQRLYEGTLVRLIEISGREGRRDAAANAARLLLASDPANEAACRGLMRCHADEGRPAQALKVYDELCARLRKELGVAPEQETTRLVDDIRQRSTPLSSARKTLPAGDGPDHAGSFSSGRPSLAVLPFDNLSGDPEKQYFTDGISDDIITELSRFRSLFVVARQSCFAFRGKPLKVQDIGRELGVAYIVEGSARRVQDRVRINAQLVDVATGNQLWAERYDREVSDILAVQDEVAQSVAVAVCGRVETASRERVGRLSPAELKAHDLVLRAKAFTMNYTRVDNGLALECAERALKLDPANARASAHAAWCQFYDHMAGWRANPRASLDRAFELSRRAVSLDETDSFAHSMLGVVQMFFREYEQSRSSFLRAISLNPNDFMARRWYANFLAATGNAEEGLDELELARRLNPFDTRWVPWNKGLISFSARRYDQAVEALRQAHNPINEVRGWLAASYAHAGRTEDARATLEEFLQVAQTDMAIFPGRRLKDWTAYWHGALEYRDQKDFDHLFDALRKAGLED
jgi:TolB-like protein/DNA-binding SARP family transcriptional activator